MGSHHRHRPRCASCHLTGGEVVTSSIAVAEWPRNAEAKGKDIQMVWSEDWR